MVHTWVSGTSLQNHAACYKSNQSARKARQTSVRSGRGLSAVRVIFILIVFLILFSGFAFAQTFASGVETAPAAATEVEIYVDSGDTLWSLAVTYKKPSMDTRDAVQSIMKRNGLSSASLQAGQTLILPAKILPE